MGPVIGLSSVDGSRSASDHYSGADSSTRSRARARSEMTMYRPAATSSAMPCPREGVRDLAPYDEADGQRGQ